MLVAGFAERSGKRAARCFSKNQDFTVFFGLNRGLFLSSHTANCFLQTIAIYEQNSLFPGAKAIVEEGLLVHYVKFFQEVT